MPIEELAREIETNLGFLQSSRRDLPERHRSLRAVFDHSWKLLSAAEQQALKQLTVFRSGFSRMAAAQVAGAIFPLLSSLVDNSLVRYTADHDLSAGRYELPESVRQYAAERLALQRTSDQQMAVFDRHSRYYLNLLGRRAADLRGFQQQNAVAEIHQEIENIRGAWRWAIADGHVALLGQAAEGLFYFFEMRSWFQEGSEAFAVAAKRLAELHSADPSRQNQLVLGKLLARQGWLTFQIGRQREGHTLLEQSLAILQPLQDATELSFPLNYLAAATSQLGDYAEAGRWAEQALAVSQACGDQHGVAVAKTVLGQIAYLIGDYENARRHSQDSLAIERVSGNHWGMVFTLTNLGHVAQAQQDYQEAEQRFREGLAIREMLGDSRGIALCLNDMGDTAAAQADHNQARRCYQRSLALFQEVGNQAGAAATLTKLGFNALALQEPAAADAAFRQALQIAWNAQATPRALEALAGMATVLSEGWGDQAAELAEQVLYHPAATQESRDRAGAVLARLAPPTDRRAQATTQRQREPRTLAAVVATLLA
jgi:tetratricopeptide (TPR) repeat protein